MRSGDLVEITQRVEPYIESNGAPDGRILLEEGSVLLIMSVDKVPSVAYIGSTYTMMTLYHANSDSVVRVSPSALKLLSRTGIPWPKATL